ncbi:glutamate--cysteine ligase catalytic subunit-like [Tachypleus tridentatus]|uniref:glutamate--cysteine ligase catalytic subunit-like n=1 Tax=Tachypleus tridentatus TaxID=6853 RepID=UPI003FD081A5
MRILNNPHPLNFEELLEHVDKVRNLACRQFIYHYNQHKYRRDDPFMWGDEIEGHIMKLNQESKTVRLHLCASKILKNLREKSKSLVGLWSDEVMESMLESCPKEPYGDVLECCDEVEKNMKERRKEVLANLGENETYLTLTMFPRFGCRYFTEPSYDPTPDSGILRSLFIPDESLCQDNTVYRTCVINSQKERNTRHGKYSNF